MGNGKEYYVATSACKGVISATFGTHIFSEYNNIRRLIKYCTTPQSLCLHCAKLTIDAAYRTVTSCSRAHFCQAQEEDLRGEKATIMDGLPFSFKVLREPGAERTAESHIKDQNRCLLVRILSGRYLWVLQVRVSSVSQFGGTF